MAAPLLLAMRCCCCGARFLVFPFGALASPAKFSWLAASGRWYVVVAASGVDSMADNARIPSFTT
ncbi:hypothetical protein PF008_g16142 [Phytophthora fragariae]|uniref:Uncharacterized protein n=1 Tax=Phytophthora fragariae TaxID=53985 RepID=A0A6G0RD87_9STRA|nr:hypothetical protein PF008_g16142 [Phytophthora fragariae]